MDHTVIYEKMDSQVIDKRKVIALRLVGKVK